MIGTYLGVVTISAKVALSNLLPVVRLPLIHPGLTRVRQCPTSALPVQIFALAGSLVAGAVLEASVCGDEMLRPLLRCGGEMRVPN